MSIDELKAAIERRGYAVQVEVDPPDVVLFRIHRGDTQIRRMYASSDIEKVNLCGMLYALDGGQQHVQCAQCSYPLLRGVDKKDTYAKLNYRSATSGPQSNPLQVCPQCRQYICDWSIQETPDA